MAGCPCASLKRGAALLAVASSMGVQPQIFFGGAVVPVVDAALHGTASLARAGLLIAWLVIAATGVFESLQGYRAAQAHRDYFDAQALARPLGAGLVCLYLLYRGWSLPLAWGALIAAGSRSTLLSAAAYNAAGLWLQLRGPLAGLFVRLPRHDPLPQFPDWGQPLEQYSGAAAELAECRAVMASLAQEVEQNERDIAARERAITEIAAERDRLAHDLARVTATRDRYQSNGKRIKAEQREIKTVLLLPGVERALVKALHPDAHGGKSAAELHAFNDGFVKLTALYQRLKAER